MHTDSERVSADELLTAVAEPQRRGILRHLKDADVTVTSAEKLARGLSSPTEARRNGLPRDSDRAQIQIQHVHLPKLDEAGVLEYDSRSGAVRYDGDERVEKLVRFVADELE